MVDPIHGLIVVKDEDVKRYPCLPRPLMDAFVAAKQPYLEEFKLGRGDTGRQALPQIPIALMSDPLPYGMAANRTSIEALVSYSLQQGLIPSRPRLDRIFVEIDP
jgi:4,5-dihydroxyphthalate decarboxylase